MWVFTLTKIFMNRHKLLYVGLFLAAIALAPVALAAEFKSAGKEDGNVSLPGGETHHNLYTAGGNVSVNSVITGDLVAAGGMVSVDGSVEDDAMVAGGTLYLNGSIGGNARVAGGNVTVASPIAGDLVIAGGNVTLSEKASIGGDLVIGGGNVIVNAPVRGSVRASGGNITINSRVEREVKVTATQKMTFGPRAEVLGAVSYRAPREAVIDQAARLSAVEFNQLEKRDFGRHFAAILTIGFLIKLLAWIIAGLLLMKIRKQAVHAIVESVEKTPWRNLGYGLVSFIIIPIVLLLVFVTVVGYYAGIIASLWYVLMLVVANLVSSIVAGALILRWLNRPGESAPAWQVVVIGVVALSVVKFIPILGWIVCGILLLMVLGAIMGMAKEKIGGSQDQAEEVK